MKTISISTKNHVIEISGGCLTIGERRFPDHCVSLSPGETVLAFILCLIWWPASIGGRLLTMGTH